jgi:hypothetical protein
MDDSVGTTTFTTTKQEDDVDATTITVYRSSGGKDQVKLVSSENSYRQ